MKKLISLFVLCMYFLIDNAYPQEQPSEANQSQIIQSINTAHMFGCAGSSVSGAGFSYMYYINPNYHFKMSGLPYQNKEEKTNANNETAYNNTVLLNGGIELRRNFFVINKSRVSFQFYNMIGGSYWYYKIQRPFSPEDNKFKKWYTGGIGIGTGFIFTNRISINFDFYYQHIRWINSEATYTGPGGGISCYIIF